MAIVETDRGWYIPAADASQVVTTKRVWIAGVAAHGSGVGSSEAVLTDHNDVRFWSMLGGTGTSGNMPPSRFPDGGMYFPNGFKVGALGAVAHLYVYKKQQ